MIETNPKIRKGSQNRRTGRFRRRQSKQIKFISKKENTVRRCEYINNDVFDLVWQVQTDLFVNLLKAFYYICGIKVQRNGSDVQYAVKNLSKLTLSVPIDPVLEAGETALTMVQKGIMDAKIKKLLTERKFWKRI